MKTIYKSLRNIILALWATMATSACDSFLDTKPYDFVAESDFYLIHGTANIFGGHSSLKLDGIGFDCNIAWNVLLASLFIDSLGHRNESAVIQHIRQYVV